MADAVLSIGSNLGDRLAHLRTALAELRPWVTAVSPVYETPPWGPVPQEDYLNAVVLVSDPDATAPLWLARSQSAERAAGRTRDVRWGPRTLDVDVVTVDGVRSDDPELTLPHPRAAERAFVLVPWAELAPDAELDGRSLTGLIGELEDAALVRRRDDLVLDRG